MVKTRLAYVAHLCIGDLLWCSNPLNLIPDLLNGVDQAADVAGDVIEKVDLGHNVVCCSTTDKGFLGDSPES